MRNKVQGIISDKRFRQASSLFAVNIVGIPIGLLTSIFLTRYLGAESFGDMKFIQSIFALSVIIFTAGFFQAGNRALVTNDDAQKSKEYYGSELVVLAGLFIVMSIALLAYAIFDPNVMAKEVGFELLCLIPFGWAYLLQKYFEVLLPADNRIGLLAKIRLYPKLGVLSALVVLYVFSERLDGNRLLIALGLYILSEIIVYLVVIFRLKASIRNLRLRIKEIWDFNKSFGFDVYVGSIFALGFAQLTSVLISYYGVDNKGVGFFALALVLCMPLAFIPNTIATTHYKDFSEGKSIPGRLMMVTVLLSVLSVVGLWLIVPPFVRHFYGVQFEAVTGISSILAIGVMIHGLGDFFNRFLGANGQGKALRNSSFLVGASTLVSSLLLIPVWGETGAAYVRVITGCVYFAVIIYCYRKYIARLGRERQADDS